VIPRGIPGNYSLIKLCRPLSCAHARFPVTVEKSSRLGISKVPLYVLRERNLRQDCVGQFSQGSSFANGNLTCVRFSSQWYGRFQHVLAQLP